LVWPLEDLPEVRPGDDLAALIIGTGVNIEPGDVVVVSQKVVSKAEGRLVSLSDVRPSVRAQELAGSLERMRARCRWCSTNRRRCYAPSAAC
jgi:coenzyme F420-0:L-glutamate ligase/coenzyme F420-1:gamma-L-glutamate ligase